MQAIDDLMARHYRPIILSLGLLILFFVSACALNGVIPVCHYLFGCDHAMHMLS